MTVDFFSLRIRRTWLAGALGLLATVAVAPGESAQAQSSPVGPVAPGGTLPALGDTASEDLGVGAERRLGERIMQEIRRDPDVLDDPLLLDYVQGIWSRLVGAARARGELSTDQDAHFAFEPFLVRDRSVNAFALPGGFVGVHLGLISMTASRDELAAVLAHELSHVTQRHIARSMTSNKRQSLLATAVMILGVLAASRSSAVDGVNAAIVGGQAAMIQGQLNFSRDMEREADRVGFGVLALAGYQPAGMMSMFDKLLQASRLNDSQQYPYLRSHPLTTERIGEARSRLGTAGVGVLESDGELWAHAAIQGRARALMDGRAVALQRLVQSIGAAGGAAQASAGSPEAFAALYAGTLAASRLRDWSAADRGLVQLRAFAARAPVLAHTVVNLQAETLLERGRGAEAQQLLAQSADGSRSDLLLMARTALAGGLGAKAQSEVLQTWVTAHPGDAQAWQILGQLQDKLGQPLASLRSQAEVRLAIGDLPGAIDRLRAGQRESRAQRADTTDAVVIESRLRQLEAKRRQQILEERAAGRGGAAGEERLSAVAVSLRPVM